MPAYLLYEPPHTRKESNQESGRRGLYTLAELIEIAEHHNPSTRTPSERAKHRARELGLAKSAYYPELEGLAVFGDQRLINPFPENLLLLAVISTLLTLRATSRRSS